MADLFSGLEDLGFQGLGSLDLYENEDKGNTSGENGAKKEKSKEEVEKEALFDKSYTCPVCGYEFKAKTIRTGKVKLQAQDHDLRPIYSVVDCLKYDAVVCPECGYAALVRFFPIVMQMQSRLIKENITPSFKGIDNDVELYSYDDAITRHKFALLNTVVKKGKNSEKAYTCLRLAWLVRGKRGEVKDRESEEYKNLLKEERAYVQNALEGFKVAFSQEGFPMCGMDEDTVTLIVSDLAFQMGSYDECTKWLSAILVSQSAKKHVKDKALILKEKVLKVRKVKKKG